MMAILGGPAEWERDLSLAIGDKRDNPPSTEGATQWFTVIPLVQAQPPGFPVALPNSDTIKSCEEGPLVMPIGFAEGEGQRMPMRFHYEVAVEPDKAVFAGVSDWGRRPFLDLITLASG
jgi:hypothetical protein